MEIRVSEQYKDLGINQKKDGDYWDIEVTGLDFDTSYALQAAWIYSDKSKGISEYSDPYNFTTNEQEGLLSPQFREQDLDAIGSIMYITWSGKDSGGADYLQSILKQVNIWIKGGDFGEEYVQYGTFFTKAGTIQINATKVSTYCVKLQAETKSGDFSLFSNEFCITLLQQPDPVFSVRHEWVKRDLVLFWKFDVNLPKNSLADSFAVQLIADGKDITLYTNVDKSKAPPLEHKIVFPEGDLAAIFGQVTAFQTDYDAFIFVRDKNLQTSTVVGYDVSGYVDPLTPPVILATKGIMSYNVSFTNNSEFDRVYIEDSTNSGVTWIDQGSSTSNPVVVPTTNSLERQVRARFSKVRGGLTGYSNIVTVTPDKIDPTDETAPANPTNVSATAVVDAKDKTGFSLQATISFTKSIDTKCKGYRVRWTTQDTNPVYEYGYVDNPSTGSTVSFTVSGLIPNVTYYYQVASVSQFNVTQEYTQSGTFTAQDSTATAEGSLARLKSYISIGGESGDLFKLGTGILDSINTSITTTPSLTAAPSTGYHGILLNKTGNKNNFWLTTGQLRVGTDTQFMYFDGTNLYLTGDINARSGKISGNLTITNGGSFIARTVADSDNRVTLNHAGIFAYDADGTETTQIISNAAAGAPTFTTDRAKIGNWIVSPNTISSSNITLTSGSNASSTSIIATNSGSYVGIKPRANSGSDIVLWAGTTNTPAANSATSGQAGFQVNADGQLYATGAIISGKLTVEAGSSLGGLLNDTSKIYYGSSTPTVPAGGHKSGDAWVDTGNSNVLKVWNTSVTPATWTVAQDSESARTIANLKNRTFYATQLTGPVRPNLTGETFVSGDLWVNSSNKNKPYRYNGTLWVEVADTDAANALENANSALSKVTDYENRFGTGVNAGLIQDLKVNTQGRGIYSSYVESGTVYAKSSYDSTTTGFYIGWDSGAGILYPALNIGNQNAFVKWNSRGAGALEVKGTIKATSGAFEGNVTAGAGAITIGPSGISTISNKFSIDTAGNAYFSGTLQAGTILSEGTVTGSTITGGIIQTAPNNTTRRIVMGSAQPDRIDFYPKSGDDADTPGYLWVSDDAGLVNLPGLVIVPPTKSTWSTPPKIKMTQTASGGLMDITAVQIAMTGTVRINTYAYHVGNVAVATNAHRNISAGTTAPSGGNTGDVYIQY